MGKDISLFISHIIDAGENILTYTKGFTEDMFLANKLVQDAVIRNLEIIGEATKNIPSSYKDAHPEIE